MHWFKRTRILPQRAPQRFSARQAPHLHGPPDAQTAGFCFGSLRLRCRTLERGRTALEVACPDGTAGRGFHRRPERCTRSPRGPQGPRAATARPTGPRAHNVAIGTQLDSPLDKSYPAAVRNSEGQGCADGAIVRAGWPGSPPLQFPIPPTRIMLTSRATPAVPARTLSHPASLTCLSCAWAPLAVQAWIRLQPSPSSRYSACMGNPRGPIPGSESQCHLAVPRARHLQVPARTRAHRTLYGPQDWASAP